LIAFLTLVILLTSAVFGAIYYCRQPFPGRTNFLVLGIAGDDRTADDLTDTIIFISADHESGKILVLSLPRDIWIPALRTKLNSVYHYRGIEETKKVVSEILGQPIEHHLLVNFEIFTEVVNQLGGVRVNVERAFDDYRYPIPGRENDLCDGDPEFKCRYEYLHFEAGSQQMDGERALKYVRSRFAEGEEGTDFARSLRQQRLLVAIKSKVFSPEFFFDPRNSFQLSKTIFAHLNIGWPREKYFDLFRLALRFQSDNLKMTVLNNDYLINPPPSQRLYDGQWVLVPSSGDWQEVQTYVSRLLD
jgi:anionic cell wall polymer biosynthesis LytR-Cps2A-Psr (LCP) family protein